MHSPIKIERECKEAAFFWEKILERALDEEFKPNRWTKRSADWWKNFKNKTKEEYFGKRVQLVRDFACKVFESDLFKDVLAFLCLFVGKPVAEKLASCKFLARELNTDAIAVSNEQMLMLHFIMGGSWTQLYKVTSGLARILKGKIKFFPATKKLWNTRDPYQYQRFTNF